MNRKVILFAITALIAGRVSVCPQSAGVARAADDVILQDNFDDNKMGTMWKVFGATTGAAVAETGKHLQFTASSNVEVPFLGYIGDKWWIDPNEDFQMKIDLFFNAYSYTSGWVCFGITTDPTGPNENYVALGIGCSGAFQNYWREWNDGSVTRMDFEGRTKTAVTLYLSYDSWYDVLYLSDTGYGEDGAWQTMSRFVHGTWGYVPLYVFLGMTTSNMDISAGQGYLDNFVIEEAALGSPYDNGGDDGGDDGNDVVTDVVATAAIVPSVIDRDGKGSNRIIASIGLPSDITLADWSSKNMPTLSPGGLTATAQTAYIWVDGKVRILAAFSKTALMSAITGNGDATVYISGKLADGRDYAGNCTITIE
ncbi:MAG: hypothetical protein ACM3VT_05035 [Solirubrobacterales bacterium]